MIAAALCIAVVASRLRAVPHAASPGIAASAVRSWRDELVRAALASPPAAALDLADAESRGSFEACVAFLARRMPVSDRVAIDPPRLARECGVALATRHRLAYARAVPQPLFHEYVVPYASFDEPRDEWRPLLTELLAPLVADASTLVEAAQRVNARLWHQWDPPIRFVAEQTRVGHPGQLSPFAVIRARNASCTGLSILLVDALRAVGVPARVAGTPVWNKPGCSHAALADDACGNHNWVEVWTGERGGAVRSDGWHFIGAAEPAELDHAWFYPEPAGLQRPGGLNVSIYAARFGPPGPGDAARHHFPMVWSWADHTVGADDVTSAYLGNLAAAE